MSRRERVGDKGQRHLTSKDGRTYHFHFGLELAQFPSRQDLYVRADLFPRSRLAGSQLDVAGNEFVASCAEKKRGNLEVRIDEQLCKFRLDNYLICFGASPVAVHSCVAFDSSLNR